MRFGAAAALALALGPLAVLAQEATATWPPPPEVLGKMRDLQAKIGDPATSKEDRAVARRELERLMKSPAAADKGEARRPARAAIDPFPSIVKPAEDRMPPVPAPPTARLEVVPERSRAPVINPSTGGVIHPTPAPGAAIDPRTGGLLHETPAGFVDPRTGRFTPK